METVAVLIPCFNEAKSIKQVLDGFPHKNLAKLGFKLDIIVINNNSTDNTATIAKNNGARIIHEQQKGKGHAIRAGINAIKPDTKYVVMLDGDNTYKSSEIYRLLEPLTSNFGDAIVGSRLSGKITHNSMGFSHRAGNWLFSFLVRQFYFANVTDALSGYFAWSYKCISKLKNNLTSNGFQIEMEMITKMAKLGFRVYSVPITYDERIGSSNLKALQDGLKIFAECLKNLSWTAKK